MTFATDVNQTLIAYFLQPGDELLLVWHLWFDNIVPTVAIESDTMIELSRFCTESGKEVSCVDHGLSEKLIAIKLFFLPKHDFLLQFGL